MSIHSGKLLEMFKGDTNTLCLLNLIRGGGNETGKSRRVRAPRHLLTRLNGTEALLPRKTGNDKLIESIFGSHKVLQPSSKICIGFENRIPNKLMFYATQNLFVILI